MIIKIPFIWKLGPVSILATGSGFLLLIFLLFTALNFNRRLRISERLWSHRATELEQRTVELEHEVREYAVALKQAHIKIAEYEHIENALRQSEMELRALINAADESIFLMKPEGTIIFLNETTARRLRATPDQLLGRSMFDLLSPKIAAQRRALLEQVVANGKALQFEDERPGIQFDNRVYPVFDACGQVTALAIFGRDITLRKNLEAALHESNLRLKLALDAAEIAIHEWDVQNDQLIWDERLYEFWGLPLGTHLNGTLFLQGLHPDDRERVKQDIPRLLESTSNNKHSIQYRVVGIQNGIERWLELHGQMHFNEHQQPVRFLGTAMDITERKRMEEILRQSEQRYQQLATLDGLTGLTNRRHLFELGELEFERARRYKRNLCAILLDVDHFKRINDSYGHLIGDQVLCELARCCQNNLRTTDLLGRYGGEEFVLLLPETSLVDAYSFAERIRKTVSDHVVLITEQPPLSITISIGVAALNDNILSLEKLIEQADQALYQAKHNGRNQVMMHTSEAFKPGFSLASK